MENLVYDVKLGKYIQKDASSEQIDEKRKKKIMDNLIWHANHIKNNPSWNTATISDLIGHFTHIINTT